jgi:hypothetical protein
VLVLKQAASHVRQHGLFFGQVEIHQVNPLDIKSAAQAMLKRAFESKVFGIFFPTVTCLLSGNWRSFQGRIVWGEVASQLNLAAAHYLAAAGMCVSIPLLRHWSLRTHPGMDLTPSMHWPPPITTDNIPADCGPVLITIDYVEQLRWGSNLKAESQA